MSPFGAATIWYGRSCLARADFVRIVLAADQTLDGEDGIEADW